MKVPQSWLRDFVPIDLDVEELANVFADLGLEVDGVQHVGEGLEGIVVAEVLDVRKHPDADRICLVDVDLGDGEALQIACGASNMTAGDMIPLATIGTTMPNGMEIAARKMRGEMSNGMLCSPSEIGLGDVTDGILILPAGTELGVSLTEALEIAPDVIWDLDILPNRPDALSIVGVARDLSARLGLPMNVGDPKVSETGSDATSMASVEILDPDLCGRFVARVLSGVTIGESPQWMAQRLAAAGMRPINNVVDVSNYVMLELGQPNHTYDLAKVAGQTLRVRRATEGEAIETLDGVTRILHSSDGVIADGNNRAIGIAGVMGGASTEISDSTEDVLVELAWWDPMSIAVSASTLNLHSEASLRFKRGCDPEIAPFAARRFGELLAETGGSSLHPGVIDEFGNLPSREPVHVRPERVNLVLGTELSADGMANLIEPIGFTTTQSGNDLSDALTVQIPSWRHDSTAEVDVIEEIGRMYGLDRIPKTVPTSPRGGSLGPRQQALRALRRSFVGAGLSEAMPLPFLAPGDLEKCGLSAEGYVVANPLAAEESVLRTSLRPGLLASVAYNAARRINGVRLFELGRVFGAADVIVDISDSAERGVVLAGEREMAAAVLCGSEAPEAVELLDGLLDVLRVGPLILVPEELPGLHPGRSARIEVAGIGVGSVGEVDPGVLDSFEINERVSWLEIDLSIVLSIPTSVVRAQPVSRYPSSDVDLAFVIDDRIPAASLLATIRGASEGLAESVDLFDVFVSRGLGEGKRSLAYRIRFQAPDRTLKDKEVARLREGIIAEVESVHGATLRA